MNKRHDDEYICYSACDNIDYDIMMTVLHVTCDAHMMVWVHTHTDIVDSSRPKAAMAHTWLHKPSHGHW